MTGTTPIDTILEGDALTKLKELPGESVDCCITSPPYLGLRDYGTAKWEGGDGTCDHVEMACGMSEKNTLGPNGFLPDTNAANVGRMKQYRQKCAKCGAIRVDDQIGLEESPEAYVSKLVEVFREVRRVLKKEGTLWLNLGSSYINKKIESEEMVLRDDLTYDEVQYIFQELLKNVENLP